MIEQYMVSFISKVFSKVDITTDQNPIKVPKQFQMDLYRSNYQKDSQGSQIIIKMQLSQSQHSNI